MAKTKAELQSELIELRNENKRAKVRLEELESDLNYVNARNTELEISNNTLLLEMRKSKSANADMKQTKAALKETVDKIKKLENSLREAKDQLQVQEEVTLEMVKQFDNVLMERHEKIKSLKSQNNNLRQTLKDTL